MNINKVQQALDYNNYQAEYENHDMGSRLMSKKEKSIIIHSIILSLVLLASFFIVVLNIDIFQPFGYFGMPLRYLTAGALLYYLMIFFKWALN